MNPLLGILTIFDSSFPTGSFARSNGYEAARQLGYITDRDSLIDFCYSGLDNVSAQHLPVLTSVYSTVTKWIQYRKSMQTNEREWILPLRPNSNHQSPSGSSDKALSSTSHNRNIHCELSKEILSGEQEMVNLMDRILDINECLDSSLVCNQLEYNASQSQGQSLLRTVKHMMMGIHNINSDKSIGEVTRQLLSLWDYIINVEIELDEDREEFAACSPSSIESMKGKRQYLRPRLSCDVPPHYTVVVALTSLSLGIDHQDCCLAVLFSFVRSTVSATVRDGLIGSNDAQQLMADIFGLWGTQPTSIRTNQQLFEEFINSSFTVNYTKNFELNDSLPNIRLTCPIIEILQSAHPLLFSKMFLS